MKIYLTNPNVFGVILRSRQDLYTNIYNVKSWRGRYVTPKTFEFVKYIFITMYNGVLQVAIIKKRNDVWYM